MGWGYFFWEGEDGGIDAVGTSQPSLSHALRPTGGAGGGLSGTPRPCKIWGFWGYFQVFLGDIFRSIFNLVTFIQVTADPSTAPAPEGRRCPFRLAPPRRNPRTNRTNSSNSLFFFFVILGVVCASHTPPPPSNSRDCAARRGRWEGKTSPKIGSAAAAVFYFPESGKRSWGEGGGKRLLHPLPFFFFLVFLGFFSSPPQPDASLDQIPTGLAASTREDPCRWRRNLNVHLLLVEGHNLRRSWRRGGY